MTFCLGMTTDEGIVGIADTLVTSGRECITLRKLSIYETPGGPMFVMTSGLRSARDKTLTYFEEALAERSEPFGRLFRAVNLFAEQIREVAAEDRRPVDGRRRSKSISEERTYGEDLRGEDAIDRALLARAEGVSRQLRKKGLVARTVHLKVRRGDFTTWTRSATLKRATDLAEPIVTAARELFRDRIDLGPGGGVRLLGVGVSSLTTAGSGQIELFLDDDEQRARNIAKATDAVRNKIGEKGITRARLLKRPDQEDDDDGEASSLPAVDG